MESIIITKIKKSTNRIDIDIKPSKGIEKFFLPEKHFFAEYSCDISCVPESVLIVPLLINLILFSWLADCIVWVPSVDKAFYAMLPTLKTAFREMYHEYPFKGTLIAARQEENTYEPKRNALQLFTGGVDATTTFLRIRNEKPVLFNTNGWFEKDIVEDEVYNADRVSIEGFAKEQSVESCFVRSNFATFIRASEVNRIYGKKVNNSWWFGFQHSMAFLGCAVVAGYCFKVQKIYIASSYTFGQEVICASDPRTDNCFKCASMEVIHDGYELSRQEKIRLIVDTQKKERRKIPLRVCSFNAQNCCTCEKCFRTILAIAAENGDLKEFGFDLQKSLLEEVKSFLANTILELDSNHIVFWRDIIARMQENYDYIDEKKVCDYLTEFPFEKKRREYLKHYYLTNFWKILKRKLKL